jgi:LacI family transcriptional regulator
MRSTIRQVAERAGVSRTTVSNVMLGRHDIVAPQKRDSVLQAVRELEYVPVRPSLQNRHVETRVIALALDDPSKALWAFHSGTYGGVCEGALRHGYDLLTLLRPDPDWATDRREVGLLDRRSDGVVFIAPEIGDIPTFEALARHKIPTVVCYRRNVPKGIAWVDPDNRDAMMGAVSHLVENGHTNIAYLMPEREQFDFSERRREYSKAARSLGVADSADHVLIEPEPQMPDLARYLKEMGVTALVGACDWITLEAWTALEKAGLSVPDDISLVGVDNSPEAAARGLTSLGFSFAEVGHKAADALVEQINGQPAAECCRSISMELSIRNSVKNLRL